jgi:hypothetical protein
MAPEIEQLVRDYAAGKISCQLLQERGIETYLNLLGMLGELGLRPPRMQLERDAEGRSALRNAILETDAELDKAVIERDGYTAESIEVLKGLDPPIRRDDRHVALDDAQDASCTESERDRHPQDD